MDSNKHKDIGEWVDERMSALAPEDSWQPDAAAGLARFRGVRPANNWAGKALIWAAATVVVIVVFMSALPSPKVLAHKCLECSVAVWQSLAAPYATQTILPESDRNAAPDFHLTGADGKVVRLSELKGKVVLLNFWATWCLGCQVEVPWFIEFQNRYASEGLVVIGLSMDDDGWKSVRPWIKEKNVNYPIVISEPEVAKQYALETMPLTVLIDRQGRIATTHSGIVNKAETENNIDALLTGHK
jgi:peroxiredoxin